MATGGTAVGSSNTVIKSVEFEVFGKVQGVFFRKVREPAYHNLMWYNVYIAMR